MACWHIYRPADRAEESEIRVAEMLKRLDDKWLIVWGYLYQSKSGMECEGDFLILGPAGGALVLEVKTSMPRIYTGTGYGECDDRGDPFSQMMKQWNGVVEAMRGYEESPFVAKAICVPDATGGDVTASGLPDVQRALVLGGDDLHHWIATWIRLFGDKVKYPVDHARQYAFKRAFCGGAPEDAKAAFISQTEELFRRQFEGQFDLLDRLSANRQLLVSGGAGTGKTMHALEQAIRYASQGLDVLFLVYNKALTSHLQRQISLRKLGTGSVTVRGWEELFTSLAGDEVQLPVDGDYAALQRFYDIDLPATVMRMAGDGRTSTWPGYDALVVDEGQDHDTTGSEASGEPPAGGWWSVYQRLLRNGAEAPASVFYDQGQRPPFRARDGFDPQALVEIWSQPAMVRLDTTLRYTRNIHELLVSNRSEGTETLVRAIERTKYLPEGPDPEFIEVAEGQTVRDVVLETVNRWIGDGLCQAHEVLVLHKRSVVDQSVLAGSKVLGSFNLREVGDDDAPKNTIRHCSINKAKGLDSKAVILVGMPAFEKLERSDDRYMWFMAVSRSRQIFAQVLA